MFDKQKRFIPSNSTITEKVHVSSLYLRSLLRHHIPVVLRCSESANYVGGFEINANYVQDLSVRNSKLKIYFELHFAISKELLSFYIRCAQLKVAVNYTRNRKDIDDCFILGNIPIHRYGSLNKLPRSKQPALYFRKKTRIIVPIWDNVDARAQEEDGINFRKWSVYTIQETLNLKKRTSACGAKDKIIRAREKDGENIRPAGKCCPIMSSQAFNKL